MTSERFVALGMANARSAWFSDLARWSTSAMIPIEFVKCVTLDEVRGRLASGRPFSALLLDGGVPGIDRDLVDEARTRDCAVIVIDNAHVNRDWHTLGASAVLAAPFTRDDLLDALSRHSTAIARSDVVPMVDDRSTPSASWRGRLVAVLGPHGAGSSTLAIALAQGLGSDVRFGGLVLLADLARCADQALIHDAGDVVPGIEELVEAHRHGEPTAAELRSLTFDVAPRNYHLLLGLRRHRDWVSIRPRAFDAALDGMRRAYNAVVADLDADLEGEAQCGSIDVEERNLFARVTATRADAVVLVGLPGPKGVHRMVRVVEALAEHGIAADRIVPVVNRAPRSPRARAELTSAYAQLVRPFFSSPPSVAGPIFVPERRRLDDLIGAAALLPAAVVGPLSGAVSARLHRLGHPATTSPELTATEPVPVLPGSLGSWSDED